MSIVYTDSQNYTNIANAIRSKLGSSDTYLPSEMPDAISSISGGGVSGNIVLNADGTYDISDKATATYIYPMPFHAYINVSSYYWAYYTDSSTSFCFDVTPGTQYTLTWDSTITWDLYRIAFIKTTSGPSTSSTSSSYRRNVYNSSGVSGVELNGYQRTYTFTIPANTDLKMCVIQIVGTTNDWTTGSICSYFKEKIKHLTIDAVAI